VNDVPLVTRRAFEELAEVVRQRGGDAPVVPADESIDEDLLVEALGKLDEETIRAVGEARADSSLKAEEYAGDPLRMLKLGASCFYEDRSYYGATSVELTQKKAIVRATSPTRWRRSATSSRAR
jgi:hypothetical protein